MHVLLRGILFLLPALLAPCAAGQATGRLSGTVQDAGGGPVAGARVTLSRRDSRGRVPGTGPGHDR